VARHPDKPVVGAGIEDVGVARRLGQGAAGAAFRSRYLGRNRLHLVTLLEGAKDKLAGAIEGPRVVAAQDDGGCPVDAMGGGALGADAEANWDFAVGREHRIV